MPDERVDQPLSGQDAGMLAELETHLARELSIEPSPELLARVRLRVADLPQRDAAGPLHWGWWQRRWMPGVALAGAAAAAIITAVVMTTSKPAGDRRGDVAAIPSGRAIVPAAVPAPDVTAVFVPPAPLSNGKRSTTAAPRTAVQVASRASEPEVLVPAGQLGAIRRFLAAVNSGRLDASPIATDAAKDPETGTWRELTITPLKIEPLPTPPDTPRER